MNKKSLPILILILIVIVCVAILVQNLAAPLAPAQHPASSASSNIETATPSATAVPYGENQPAGAPASPATSTEKLKVITIEAPAGTISAEVASTSEQQAKGLGERGSLPADQGMLFPFLYPGDYGFWMKDMYFPIDIVWISSNKKVVVITPDVSPDTYPTVFYPPLAISYVLELNAGAAARLGIATDTELTFTEKYSYTIQ